MLAFYRRVIAARRDHLGAGEPGFAWLDHGPGVLAFARGGLTCLLNVSAAPVALPGEAVVASAEDGRMLAPDTAAWVLG
ncbi:MAG TPA: hypothetical protein VGN18_04400 [Jatrophihabitans sp.]|jgi:alpha-glucosidase|uniref:hypothetical protein n=1 Tax=Jatrophihabitans sp. TaxID=1932789 RepID=UPI002E0089CE|nr:hypothetical protein [Jatrophihabitans sp.]